MIPIKDYAGSRRRLPWMTWGLIAVNVLIFLYQLSLGPDAPAFMFAYSVVPVAYFAHVGGFVTGLVITLLLRSWLLPPANVSYPHIPRHPGSVGRSEWWQ